MNVADSRWLKVIVIHPNWVCPRFWRMIQMRIEKRDGRP